MSDFAVATVRAAPVGYWQLARLWGSLVPSLAWHRVETDYGTMTCAVDDPACFPLVKFGCYPHWKEDEEVIASLPLDRDSAVVDVGANVGAMSRLFSRRAGVVHAFEPSPKALKFLRANAEPNVVIHPVALSDRSGVRTFAERESTDLSSFADEGIKVETRTLDSFAIEADLIKIDVEGFEPEVLRGAHETLARSPIILFEALDEAAFAASRDEILAANPRYTFQRISAFNCLATCR